MKRFAAEMQLRISDRSSSRNLKDVALGASADSRLSTSCSNLPFDRDAMYTVALRRNSWMAVSLPIPVAPLK